MAKDWLKKAVVYQIFVRSFCDSNKDGTGDLNGAASKLSYIRELGANAVLLSPVNKSPLIDGGCDVSNYRSVNPAYGTTPDFNRLVKKAHNMGIKVILDFPVNHTSIEHPWFKKSRSEKESKLRDFYIWRDPKKIKRRKHKPPNSWISFYGGPAWTYDKETEQYYLHLHSPYHPDLNWDNPILRREVYLIMKFWLDKGIDGLRLNSFNLISKPQSSGEDDEEDMPDGNEKLIVPNGRRIHEYLQEMNREVFSKYNIVTIGEAAALTPSGVTINDAVMYANDDGCELNAIFNMDHIELESNFKWTDKKIDLMNLKQYFMQWQTGLYGNAWSALAWCNYNQSRFLSRLCDDTQYREKAATMLAVCLYFMQGTPFIYQGEELGMTNAPFAGINDYRDLESINAYIIFSEDTHHFSREKMLRYLQLKSRDNAQTPMQWNEKDYAGFSGKEPWIMINPNYKEINAEEQKNRPGSVLKFYQKLIKCRKDSDVVTKGSFELLFEEHSDLFVYSRTYKHKKLLVVCNFTKEERTFVLPDNFTGKNILIANDETHRTHTMEISARGYRTKPCVNLGPYGAVVFRQY